LRKTPIGVLRRSAPGRRDRANAYAGSSTVWSWITMSFASTDSVGTTRRPKPPGGLITDHWFALPNVIGCPCSSRIRKSSRVCGSLRVSKAPSLKMLQFW
jgi:hypothetical protein